MDTTEDYWDQNLAFVYGIMFIFNFGPVPLLHNSPGFSGAPPAGNLACFTLQCVVFNFLLYGSEQFEQGIRKFGACGLYSQQHGGGVWISGHYSALTSSLSVKFPVLIKSGSGEEQGGTVGIFISMICWDSCLAFLRSLYGRTSRSVRVHKWHQTFMRVVYAIAW